MDVVLNILPAQRALPFHATPTTSVDQGSAELEVTGAIAYLSDDHDRARLVWKQSHDLAVLTGNIRRAMTTAANLDLMDRGIPIRLPNSSDPSRPSPG